MNMSEIAAARWQRLVVPAAISADDFTAAAELLEAGVPQETIRTLYPLDFAALLNHVANQLNTFGVAPRQSSDAWVRLYNRREELLRDTGVAQRQLDFVHESTVSLVLNRLRERAEIATAEAGCDYRTQRRAGWCLFTACWVMVAPVEAATDKQAFFTAVTDLLLPHLCEVSA